MTLSTSSPTLPPEKIALVERLAEAVERAKSMVFVIPDDSGFFATNENLIDALRDMIEHALGLMAEVRDLYDEEQGSAGLETGIFVSAGEEDDFLREIGAAISSELAAQEVSNIAFAVRAQLVESHLALRGAIANGNIWTIASEADTGLRRAGKGLITLEHTIREYEGLEPVERTWSPLEDSQEIRRLYGQFRRGILRPDPPADAEDLGQALRGALRRISALRNREIYSRMRICDRVPIRRLQQRIHDWTLLPAGPASHEQGLQLWGDLTSFAELLVQINFREELRAHDHRVIQEWLTLYFPEGEASIEDPPRTAQAESRDRLDSLSGRCDELDLLLLAPQPCTLEDLRVPLERMHRELNRPFQPMEQPIGLPF